MASEREARIEALPQKVQQWLRTHQGKTYRDNGATAAVIAYLTAPSAAPASAAWDREAAEDLRPSPEPQRSGAGAGLAYAVRMFLDVFTANEVDKGVADLTDLERDAIDDLRAALAAEQAREPDGRDAEDDCWEDSEEVRALKGHVQHQRDRADLAVQRADALQTQLRTEEVYAQRQRKRAEQAESAFKEADAERQIAQDALWAYREQVEALRGRAKEWMAKNEHVARAVATHDAAWTIIRDLAALPIRDYAVLSETVVDLPTEPEGQDAKADAGEPVIVGETRYRSTDGVAVLRRLRSKFTHGVYGAGMICAEIDRLLAEAESQPEGEADAWDGTLMDGLRAEPPFSLNIDEGEARVCGGCPGCIWNDCEEGYTPNPRYTLKGEAESPAKLATQRAIEADLADDEGEAREGDDVLRGFVERVENPNESNGPDAAEIDAAVAVLAKRALEGR